MTRVQVSDGPVDVGKSVVLGGESSKSLEGQGKPKASIESVVGVPWRWGGEGRRGGIFFEETHQQGGERGRGEKSPARKKGRVKEGVRRAQKGKGADKQHIGGNRRKEKV